MKNAIELTNVSAGYNGEYIIKEVSCSIPEGTIAVVIGPSGAGKTSLVKLMNGLLLPKRGSLSILGEKSRKNKQLNIKKNIGYIPQHLGLIQSMTALENVLAGSLARVGTWQSLLKIFPGKEKALASKLLSMVGLQAKKNKRVLELSGGEKRRVAIARAFMQKPKILLADEMLSDLDIILVQQITKQLQKLRDKFGTTIVMVEHDLKIAKSIGDQIMILREGKNKGVFPKSAITDKLLNKAFAQVQQ